MAIEILLPRLGWTMEEGTLVEWIKHDGDAIQPGDVLYTVESDKTLNEVESFDAGILRIPAGSPRAWFDSSSRHSAGIYRSAG